MVVMFAIPTVELCAGIVLIVWIVKSFEKNVKIGTSSSDKVIRKKIDREFLR